ncbi:MAG: hypothetical protein JWM31_2604, partial [Solirubrobacterales bacterium]|nr:hypothetical protein [Solirubrobacterales bacterium]
MDRGVGRYVIALGAAEAALVVADALVGDDIALSSTYVAPVLLFALVADRRAVTVAVVLAFALAAGSGLVHDIGLARQIVRLAIVLVAGVAAAAYATVRERLAGEIGRQRRLAAENAGLLDELQGKERELNGVVQAIADAVLVHDAQGVPLYANQAAADVLGLPDAQAILDARPGEIPSRFSFTDEEGRPLDPDVLPGRRIFAGEQAPADLLLRSVDRHTGREMWTVTKASAVRGPGGEPALAVNVIEDVTDTRRREAATTLLAEAGDVLGASLDLQETLDRVVTLVVPRLADWCNLDLPTPRGVRVAAVAHVDPARAEATRQLLERHPVRPDDRFGVAAVLRDEPSFVRADLTPERLAAHARDAEHLRGLVDSGLRHLMVVGMRAGGETIGALSFARGADRAAFTQDELRLAEELARRAGTAVLNARLYQERTEIANTLQRSLLPPELPQPAGLRMASHYRAIGRASQVGGDFYDAFPLPDGWLVAIGDVTGKGAAAAALTGLARSALEAVATLTGRPALALAHLHGLLARRGDMALVSMAAVHLHAGP